MWACGHKSLDEVRALIAAGADVNNADEDGFGPLMCACVQGRTEIVRFLLDVGAAADRPDAIGRTPLSWTVTKGDFVETVELLVSAGADINRADDDGFTPLMRAALTEHPRCFEFLIKHGADTAPVNAHWHKNALEMAIERGSDQFKRLAENIRSGRRQH